MRATIEGIYPLTPTQEGMLVNTLRHPERGVEIEQLVVRLEESVDRERMEAAWEFVVARHAALRTRFRWTEGDAPTQEVLASIPLPFEVTSTSRLASFLDEDRRRGFDLAVAPLFRLTLVDIDQALPCLVFTFHHAILDGRSFRIVLTEALSRYDEGESYAPPPRPAFQLHCEAVARRDRAREREHFTGWLADATPSVFPSPRRIGRHEAREHAEVQSTIPGIAHRFDTSGATFGLGAAVQTAWAVVLATYARTDDVTFGSTRAGRYEVEGASEMVGCLVNTVPIRARIAPDQTLGDVARAMADVNRSLRTFEQVSLSELHGWLKLDRPLFESIVVFERYLLDRELRAIGGAFATRSFEVHERSNFPLVLAVYRDGDDLRVALEHDPRRWSSELVETWLARLTKVLEALVSDRDRTIDTLDVMLPGELARIHAAAEPTRPAARGPGNVGESFDVVVRSSPQSIAFEDGVRRVSYAELDVRQRQIEAALRELDIERGEPVAVCLSRSLDFVAALICLLRKGWIYVPLDPRWPAARAKLVLDDAAPRAILVDAKTASSLDGHAVPFVRVDEIGESAIGPRESWMPEPRQAEAPAYVLYTSGSTGNPKGVVVPQRALAAHTRAAIETYGLDARDRVLQFASLAFDVALEEIIPTLLAGATIVPRSDASATDAAFFLREVELHSITVLNLPSAFFHELMLHLEAAHTALPHSVRLVVIGSERPTPESYRRFRERHPQVRIVNAYGPTEVTITSLTCTLDAPAVTPDGRSELPIGKPFGETRAYILDRRLRPAPIGVAGELCLGGPQLALGYRGAPELTRERFVPDPFGRGLLYRTGDLGVLEADGLFEFHGRVDDQLKVRGFRIEPGEIEQALRQQANIADAAVVGHDAGRGMELVAFVVPKRDVGPLEPRVVLERLALLVPPSFVPSRIDVVEALPTSSSGKVDRRALVARAATAISVARTVEGPEGDTEAWIARLFVELLGRDDIDVNESFFDLGGHSLLAVRLLSELNRRAPEPLTLATIFAQPSVRGLARAITRGAAVDLPSIVRLNRAWQRRERDDRAEPMPFFCMCGVQLYAPLAQAMEADREVYGAFLPVETSVGTERAQLDVRTMAHEYLALVRSARPRGPYMLGGVSFGGLLAYEMAQQLRRDGEEVALLVLLDTILPRALRATSPIARIKQSMRRGVERMGGRDPRELARAARGVMGRVLGRNELEAEDEPMVARDRAFRAASEAYDRSIKPYRGRTVVVRARQGLGYEGETVDWDLGWSSFLPADSATFAVDGDHLGILREPGVIEIARLLRAFTVDLR